MMRMSSIATMRFASAVSDAESTSDAVAHVVEQAQSSGLEADIAFVFFTAHHRDDAQNWVESIWLEFDPQVMVGCSAEGVIGADREIERAPGIALLVGQLPGVRLHPFHISADDWRGMIVDPADKLVERLAYGPETRALLGFGDPFTTPLAQFLPLLDAHAPGAPLIGGMASSAQQPGENLLIRNDQVFTDGFVGVSLAGAVDVETVVSQGCSPVGRTLVITKARENVIEQLGGKPALQALREMVEEMTPDEKAMLGQGLLVGRAISEYRETFGRGDFLVRNLMGVDQTSGSIAVTDYVRVGQTIQFHVRDAATATDDLDQLLRFQRAPSRPPAAGALLFSCNGRGTRLFDSGCHDISAARAAMPDTPIAGFFAAGEFGPVGGKNFVHGHTASFALLRPREPGPAAEAP
jgi:small ligand-binding sensory domain FIST